MNEPKNRREIILATIVDAVRDLVYYDRREDEELPRGAIDEAVAAHEITVDEMVEKFRACLVAALTGRST